jgi:serine/threonine-protein kinase RsbW
LLLVRKDVMTLGGEVRLAAIRPHVREVFELTGFIQVFALHMTIDDAREAFGQSRA